jgi:hypothetical protein
MSTWLLDTPLFNMLATPKAKPLLEWCAANRPSMFISAASLTEVARGIDKLSGSQSQRANAQRKWLDEILTRFADRVHPVDAAIATRAGESLPSLLVTSAIGSTTHSLSRRRRSTATASSRAATGSSGPGQKFRLRRSSWRGRRASVGKAFARADPPPSCFSS